LQTLEAIQKDFNGAQSGGKKVSLADLIVLGGSAAVEEAAKEGRPRREGSLRAGRTDASQEQTDVHSFAVLEPTADGFRNYIRKGQEGSAAELLVDKANLLTLTAPEMTVLIGGLRALNANFGQSAHGVFTKRPGTLTNDFFVNLLDMNTKWQKSGASGGRWKGMIGRPASSSGRALWSIWSSVRTLSFEPSRKSMRAATGSRSSCMTLWRPGAR
jgi:catalase-peroxidase